MLNFSNLFDDTVINSRLFSVDWIDNDLWIGKAVEGSSSGLIETVLWHFLGETE